MVKGNINVLSLPDFEEKYGVIVGSNNELIAASFDGDFEKAARLLAGGADINYIDPVSGMSCLHIACATGNRKFVEAILDFHRATKKVDFSLKTSLRPRRAWQLAMSGHHYDIAHLVDDIALENSSLLPK